MQQALLFQLHQAVLHVLAKRRDAFETLCGSFLNEVLRDRACIPEEESKEVAGHLGDGREESCAQLVSVIDNPMGLNAIQLPHKGQTPGGHVHKDLMTVDACGVAGIEHRRIAECNPCTLPTTFKKIKDGGLEYPWRAFDKALVPDETQEVGLEMRLRDWDRCPWIKIVNISLYGIDVSRQIAQSAMMNLVLQVIRNANVKQANTLSVLDRLTEDALNQRQ